MSGARSLRCAGAFLSLLAACGPASAQDWQSLNPGGGGQIQDVVLDPARADHAFLLSDVEGLYRTEDGGERWIYSSRGLAGTNTLALAYDPLNPSRLYLGTTVGLHTSNDGGRSWRLHPDTRRAANPDLLTLRGDAPELAVGAVVVDPRNSQRVLAGVGNERDSTLGRGAVFRSTDGASSFEVVRFGGSADSSVLQLALDPASGAAYAATAADGLWRGEEFGAPDRWTRTASPADADGRTTGVAVAPDGTLYAAFGREGSAGTALYASRDAGASWSALDGTGRPDGGLVFRTLAVDPRSDAREHALLSAPTNERAGLWQVSIDWTGGTPTSVWERVFWYDTRDAAPFPTGWEGGIYGNRPRPLAYDYTPIAWGGRGVWTTGDQTLFRVDDAGGAASAWADAWRQIYTRGPVQTLGPVTVDVAFFGPTVTDVASIGTWTDRGWASTVDMDVARVGDVVLRSGADHAVTLSYDNGRSWEDVSSPRRAKSQSNAVVMQDGRTLLLAHFTGPLDFGAANTQSELWGAEIDPSNPGPVRWRFLAGGSGTYGAPRGLPNDVYTAIVPDPATPGLVYVAARERGVYAIPDIGYLYDARVGGLDLDFYPRVDGSPGANEYEGAMVLDPNDSAALWVASGNELLRGTRDDSGGGRFQDRPWRWTTVLRSERLMTFDAWDRDGRTVVAAAATVDGVSGLHYSEDAGANWQRISTAGELMDRRSPSFDFGDESPTIFAVAGRGERIWTTVQTFAPSNLGHGMYELTLPGRGAYGVRDVTGNLPFPKSFRTETIADVVSGEAHLYLSSWGAGTWRLPIEP